ncbi:hypothetical protein ACEPAH_7906 [Sanghuangporus vaninii]
MSAPGEKQNVLKATESKDDLVQQKASDSQSVAEARGRSRGGAGTNSRNASPVAINSRDTGKSGRRDQSADKDGGVHRGSSIPPDDRQKKNKLREEYLQTHPQERYQKFKGIGYGFMLESIREFFVPSLVAPREFRDDILKQEDVKGQTRSIKIKERNGSTVMQVLDVFGGSTTDLPMIIYEYSEPGNLCSGLQKIESFSELDVRDIIE